MENTTSTNSFIIENGTLLKFIGDEKSVSIPDTVTKIGADAFFESDIEELSFANNSVKSIDERAFKNCKNLNYIYLPDGLLKIDEKAFFGCSSLQCAYIPPSVKLIEKDAFNLCFSTFYVIGEKKSTAEEFARSNYYGFKTGKAESLEKVKSTSKKVKGLSTQTFDIFGETVTCSNSLPLYVKVKSRYDSIAHKDSMFVKDIVEFIPVDYQGATKGNLRETIEKQIDKAIAALKSEGVVVEKSHAWLPVMPHLQELVNQIGVIMQIIKMLRQGEADNIDAKVSSLRRKVESQVTGLSYGVIGDTLDLILYDMANIDEKKRQRDQATKKAEQELLNFKVDQSIQLAAIYSKKKRELLPAIEDLAIKIAHVIEQWELESLEKAGLLDLKATSSHDPEKSHELVKSSRKLSGDEVMLLAMALKKYPYNLDAIIALKAMGESCKGLNELVEFLDLKKDVSHELPKAKKDYIKRLESTVSSFSKPKDAINLYLRVNEKLDSENNQKIVDAIVKSASNEINSFIKNLKVKPNDDITELTKKKINDIVTEKQWKALADINICPISAAKTSEKACSSRQELITWTVGRVGAAQKTKEKALTKALEKIESAQTLSELMEIRKSLVALKGFGESVSAITKVDKMIADAKYNEIVIELGNSRNHDDLKCALEKLKEIKDHVPSQAKADEIQAIINKQDTRKNKGKLTLFALSFLVLSIASFFLSKFCYSEIDVPFLGFLCVVLGILFGGGSLVLFISLPSID